MKFIYVTCGGFNALSPDEQVETVELAASVGFDAFLKLWHMAPEQADVLVPACHNYGMEFIATVPMFDGMPPFEASDGSTAPACPNYAWNGLEDRLVKDISFWCGKADSLYVLGGLDWYGYPNRPMIGGDPWKRKRDGLLWTASAEFRERFAQDIGGAPAMCVADDPSGKTLSWYFDLVDLYFTNAFHLAHNYGFDTVYMYQTLDMYRTEYAFQLGRVMSDLRVYRILETCPDELNVWQICYSNYQAFTTALEFAIYRKIMPVRTVVGAGWANGLVQDRNALRAVRDGHDGVLVSPVWMHDGIHETGTPLKNMRNSDYHRQITEAIQEAKAV